MNKALISFSFDDARGDNTVAFDNILVPRKICATLNVTTGYVDGTAPKEMLPYEQPAMALDDIIRFEQKHKFEVALHGDKHLNTEEDIDASYNKITKWLDHPEGHRIGFASPNSGLNLEKFKLSEKTLFKEKIDYVRTSFRIKKMKFLKVLFRKLARVWRLPIFYKWAYQDTIMKECTDRIIYSVPIMNDTTWKQVACLVRECIKKRGALTLMFHSIDEGSSSWSWSPKNLIRLCDYIITLQKEGTQVDICTTRDIFRSLSDARKI